jgi:tetraacyldisaccharide 4'-kinase
VIPAGPLRAPLAVQIERTDALIVIGEGSGADAVASRVAARGKPVLRAHFLANDTVRAQLVGKRVLAFAGIGDPMRFFSTLNAAGIAVVRDRAFADHHAFSKREIDALIVEAKRDGLILVTTEKDFVRLPDKAGDIVPFAVTLAFDDAASLRRFVSDRLFKAREKQFRT